MRFRSILGRIVESTRDRLSDGQDSQADSIYKCIYCNLTFDTRTDQCPECRIGRLVPTGPEFESRPGLKCRMCQAIVDHRHELCPECGSPRFEGM